MSCCPVLLSLYCTVIVFLNEINGDGDGDECVGGCVCLSGCCLLTQ